EPYAHCFLRLTLYDCWPECGHGGSPSASSAAHGRITVVPDGQCIGSRSPEIAHSYLTRSGRPTVTRLPGEGRDPFVRAREFAGWVPASAGSRTERIRRKQPWI